MNHGTDGDVAQRQVVTWLDVSGWATFDLVALGNFVGRNDVTLFTIGVVQQCNTGRAVWVVLNVSDRGGNTIFIGATEVNDAVSALVTATLVTRGDPTSVVTSTLAVQGAHQ
ncbi:unannotated protein [freshwater metagenome]|uniref:Unannotated protein n=1 Tax=freshwater metagenome TaxID=449393 RepID=A0A6J7EQL2_9ZZZZ